MSQKRKAMEPRNAVIDKESVTHYAKKARTWCENVVSHGLKSVWNDFGLRTLEELAHQQRRPRYSVVGEFPRSNDRRHNTDQSGQDDSGEDTFHRKSTWSKHNLIFHTDNSDSSQNSSRRQSTDAQYAEAAPYTLGPFSLSPYVHDDTTPIGSSQSVPFRSLVAHSNLHSRFYKAALPHVNGIHPIPHTPFELRPRISSGRVGKRTPLLQSKYYKDESVALNQLASRYASSSPAPQYRRTDYTTTINQSLGISDAVSVSSSRASGTEDDAKATNIPSYDNRFRRYGRLQDIYDEQENNQESKVPAWTKTKLQTPRWKINLERFKNLIAKNLPSIEKQGLSPAHQAAVDKHEKIEHELERREAKTRFSPLSSKDLDKVQKALGDGYGPVVEGFNVTITKNDIRTLRPGEWLNDEVINFYGNLIMARSNTSSTLPKVHVFSTFFYKTLSEIGYDKVRRWTKKTNIFAKDYLLIPIHCSGNHWTSAVIDMKNKKISYYDSLLGNNPKCFVTLRNYLEQESLDKLKIPFNFQGWENECPKNIPKQQNGYDCGVFTCSFIESKSRGAESFDFTQADMPYLRQKMVLGIVNKELVE